jgi:hypothetical protein
MGILFYLAMEYGTSAEKEAEKRRKQLAEEKK